MVVEFAVSLFCQDPNVSGHLDVMLKHCERPLHFRILLGQGKLKQNAHPNRSAFSLSATDHLPAFSVAGGLNLSVGLQEPHRSTQSVS
jgi:hypothetical protein